MGGFIQAKCGGFTYGNPRKYGTPAATRTRNLLNRRQVDQSPESHEETQFLSPVMKVIGIRKTIAHEPGASALSFFIVRSKQGRLPLKAGHRQLEAATRSTLI